jgi:hypothetical protein
MNENEVIEWDGQEAKKEEPRPFYKCVKSRSGKGFVKELNKDNSTIFILNQK